MRDLLFAINSQVSDSLDESQGVESEFSTSKTSLRTMWLVDVHSAIILWNHALPFAASARITAWWCPAMSAVVSFHRSWKNWFWSVRPKVTYHSSWTPLRERQWLVHSIRSQRLLISAKNTSFGCMSTWVRGFFFPLFSVSLFFSLEKDLEVLILILYYILI